MLKQHQSLILTIVFLLFCGLTAQGSGKTAASESPELKDLTLEKCIELSLKYNPDLGQFAADVEAAKAEAGISRGKMKPELKTELGFLHSIDDQAITKPRRVGDRIPYIDDIVSGDLVLSVPIFTGNRLENRHKSNRLQAEASQSTFERGKDELIFSVSNIFFSMLGQKEVINSLEFSKDAMKQHQNRVQEFVDAQKAAKVDLLRTEVRLADIEQRLIKEKNMLNVQRTALLNMMGVSCADSPDCLISGKLTVEYAEGQAEETLEKALKNRPDYLALSRKLEAQRKIVAATRAERVPQVFLKGSYGNRWTGAPGDGRSEEAGQIMVTANFPVFDGGQINSAVRRESEKVKKLEEQLRKLMLKIQLDLKVARLNIQSTRARIAVTEKAIEQAQESYRIEKEKYDFGKGVIVDVLDAQAALLESQTNHYRALADFNTAVAQLKLAAGEIK
ncbi:MAG: TolC family protein [Candidatus Rifleibacteriota bacterium]